MEDRDKIIEKIRRCLALGDSARNPNEHEVEAAIRQAKSLMAHYNLTMAEVAERDGTAPGNIKEEHMAERSGAPSWEYDLPWVCDELFGTRHFTSLGWPDYKKSVVFYGYEADVALSVEVYKLLKLELMELGLRWSKTDEESRALSPKRALVRRFKYIDGVVLTLRNRAYQKAAGLSKADESRLNAMVVAKEGVLKAWAKERYDLKTRHKRHSDLHDDALGQGIEDGKKVGINFEKGVKGSAERPLRLGHNKED